jgi:hypothetical protein
MPSRIWIKLYIEILGDPKMGRLPNHLWRRAVELFLLAGKNGNDGLLPPVEEMAWIFRLDNSKVLDDLQSLAGVGVVDETPNGWRVTNFKKRQVSESADRVRRFRERYSNGECNADVAEDVSTSSSDSESVSGSDSEGVRVQGEGERLPDSPLEAAEHPDMAVFCQVTGGRLPGVAQYQSVIETVRYLRKKKGLDDPGLARYLLPYWKAWAGRKRKDGKPYSLHNITWLTEWAMNGSIPPGIEVQDQEDVIRKVARGQA